MPGKRTIHFWSIVLWIQSLVFAQEPFQPLMQEEDFLYKEESTSVPNELLEGQADLLANPVNLNSASSDQLGETGLFTPYQIHQLIRYRERFGSLYSVFELSVLPGFRRSRLMEIATFLSVEPENEERSKQKNRPLFLVQVGKVLPEAAGYRIQTKSNAEPAYKGSPFRCSLRYKSRLGRYFSTGLCYEKDPGENFLAGGMPEFLSGYVQYTGTRQVRQLVVGNFQLNQGLGLVFGAGFMHAPANFSVSRPSLALIRPYSSKREYGFERGAAIKLELRPVRLLAWFSHRRLDLSTLKLEEGSAQPDWNKYLRSTGLHRTVSEQNGRDLASRIKGGLQVLFSHHQLVGGLALNTAWTGLNAEGIKKTSLQSPPVLTRELSFHAVWFSKGWQVFGEFALSEWESVALLGGVRWDASDFLQCLLLLHHYGKEYSGSLPASYASGSKIQNESGLALHLHLEPGSRLQADFTGEMFFYPGPRYLTQVPSQGQRYTLCIRNAGLPNIQWRLKAVKKIWQSTPKQLESGLRPLVSHQLTRIDVRISGHQVLQWQSRLLVSFLEENRKDIPSYAVVQQFSWQLLRQLRSTLQCVVFDVRDWNERMYIYEPGLYYSFNFPSMYGRGYKTTLIFSLKAMDKLTLAAKVSCANYHHTKNLGAGNDLIPGQKKWILEAQLRLNL